MAVGGARFNTRVQLGKQEAKWSGLFQATETVAVRDYDQAGPWLPGNPVTITGDKVALPCPLHGEAESLAE